MSLTTPRKKNDRGQNIQVFVRVRPLNQSERDQGSWAVLNTVGPREVEVQEKPNNSLTKKFNFDRVFGPKTSQEDVYKTVVGRLINEVTQGYNCTVFAYGQTGTGKTHTMEGKTGAGVPIDKDPNAGMIPRALGALFDHLYKSDATEWSVRVSFLELYNEEIFDLLSASDDHPKLRLYDDGVRKGSVVIQGLEEVRVHDKQEVYRILERGSERRRTAETKMNANSSRSHTVFTVTVYINQHSPEGDDMYIKGKLNLVDLAGSESIGRSGAVDKRAKEAGQINQSLLSLGRVIKSLVSKEPHVPYRDSKLTRLLQDSLGGKTKTSIIATVSPASINVEETLSTLTYANTAKGIQNRPEVNQKISKREQLSEYHAEIDKLKSELQAARDKDGVFMPKELYDKQIKDKEWSDKEIQEKTLLLKAMEEELEKLKEIFAETTEKLQETIAQKEKTQRALDCTRTVLHKTEGERAEQAHLVARHVDTECKLNKQAQLLLTVSDEATKDLDKVHNKLDRKRIVEAANEETFGTYKQSESQRHSKLEQLVAGHVQDQTSLCGESRSKIKAHAGRRAEERTQLTDAYGDTVEKLIQTMGDIERVTSEHMYTEQSWVEQLLKRVRNEADSATNDFHGYLVQQLLTVSTKILDALQKQDKSVQNLSAKMDKNFAGLTEKLETYLAEQETLRQKKLQAEADFFAGLERRNAALTSTFDNDAKDTEEYVKKSQAFNDQMMSLIKAKAKEEESFLNSRNASMTQAKAVTVATAEATASAQVEAKDLMTSFANLEVNFKDNQDHIMMRMKSEKTSALDEINLAGQSASKATTVLRTDAEAFAQKAKDQWANHYARTEASLREKSDKSSAHVSTLQSMTGNVRKVMLEGQKEAEEKIENWRRADDQATRDAHEATNDQCAALSDFESKLRDEIRAADQAVANLIDNQIKRDQPTGETPGRVSRKFPRSIIQGTPDDIRKSRFRQVYDTTGKDVRANMDFESADSDLLEDETPEGESADDTRDSVFSNNGSGGLSRQDSGGSLPVAKATKATSRTNLSEASTDTGILGDIDNKENFNDKQFSKPARKPSKLKAPEVRSTSGSRSSSRNRGEQKLVR